MESVHEEWRPIPGFEGFYEASSLGRVRSLPRLVHYPSRNRTHRLKGKVLRLVTRTDDYFVVTLSMQGVARNFNVHHLVACAFYGDKSPDFVVNHIDGDRQNNRVENLEWVTWADNSTFSVLQRKRRRELPPRSRSGPLTEEDVLEIRRLSKMFRHRTLAEHYGVHYNTITHIVHGRTWRHLLPPEERERTLGKPLKVVRLPNHTLGIVLSGEARHYLGLTDAASSVMVKMENGKLVISGG